ncbi:hypothetical protein [Sphingobacterium bambusae]|uniref:Lipoprotein n=1 Tax=Sphingobacterium bambusae TaxID=662858 RepID=A0ABW6BCT1_9SPHI|nr:hypothetical protein [Sphingobacterium bambusae]WPL49521.1 hypothetical protein SCB77_03535 [Sphingobacterium bambusae]
MRLKISLFFLIPFLALSGCAHVEKSPTDQITIYYENGNVDDSGVDYPHFVKLQALNPSLFRDRGTKMINSSLFYSFCRELASANYTLSKDESIRWSGDYKMFFTIKGEFSDSLMLNKDNVYYSISKQKGVQLDSLSYVIRNAIEYFNMLTPEELSDFRAHDRYGVINYSYEFVDYDSLPPSLYTKIVLVPCR